uniref:Exosome protein n=1 Tax=Ignisphaera aggregans TaxID=334771 RepID=A0A7C5UVZ9_9CREN
MNRKIELSEVILSTHCHATEDLEKVKKALMNSIPLELRSIADVHSETLHGYHGNPIVKLEVRFKGDDAFNVVKYIISMLSDVDKRYLLNSLDMRYNRKDNKLFLRLDKQEAYLGNISLYEGDDSIKVSISFSMIRSIDAVKEFLERMLIEDKKRNEGRHVSSN